MSCDSSGVGTGFLVGPDLIATVDHVVDQAAVISLIDGTQRTGGTVIGVDAQHDLALVRATKPLTGFHFALAQQDPAIGIRVAAIGFPIGDPITLTQGGISGLHRNINVSGSPRTDMIETDAAVNPGNSGGPLLDGTGTVVGLVDALNTDANGIAYAVPAVTAGTEVGGWKVAPHPQAPAQCSDPLGPSEEANPELPTPGGLSQADAQGIAAMFDTYFNGINTGNYEAAWSVLSPRLQAQSSESSFAAGDSTSFDSGIQVLAASGGAGVADVELSFNSIQAAEQGPNGDNCDNWTLDYSLIQANNGEWLIDGTSPISGSDHTPC